jgi:hypothetical protein
MRIFKRNVVSGHCTGGYHDVSLRCIRHNAIAYTQPSFLSMQWSFAVFPLVMFTSDKLKMAEFHNPYVVQDYCLRRCRPHRPAQYVATHTDFL